MALIRDEDGPRGRAEGEPMSRRVRVTKVFSSEREIVVGVDGSEHARDAVRWAVREARLREAVLRPIGVAPIGSDVDFDWTVGDSSRECRAAVNQAVKLAEELEPTVVIRAEVAVGPVAETLALVSEVADLLVVGARGLGGMSEFLLGSVSRSCVRDPRCPIVVVHELASSAIEHTPSLIVVGMEKACGSDALEWAFDEALRRSADVEAVLVRPPSRDDQDPALLAPADEEFTRFISSYTQARAHGLRPLKARCTSTVKVLLEACHGADLLVIGQPDLEGRHAWGAGSRLRRCIQLSPCPVVVVGPSTSHAAASREGLLGSDT